MRGTPLPRGTTSQLLIAGCLLVLACVVLRPIDSALAAAVACPNAQFRSGPSEHLPDCRAYEQVSPVEKEGNDAVTLQPLQPYVLAQSSPCEAGEECAIAYMNVAGAFAGAPSNEVVNAYVGTRGAEGWRTTALTPPTPQAPANSVPLAPSFTYAFSEGLSQTVLRVPLQQLTANAPAGVYNLFLRQPDGAYSLITAAAPAQPPQAECAHCFEQQDLSAFAGASADFAHVIFEANDSLVEGAPEGVENLYESSEEHVRLVGVLPDGKVPPQGAVAGGGIDAVDGHTGELAHAISADGSHILFETDSDGGPAYAGGASDPAQSGQTELYDRIDASSTLELSAPGPGAEPSHCETEDDNCEAEPAQFWAASADGSVVYFTSAAALTKDSYAGAEGSDLYRYDLATRTLTNLVAEAVPAAGAEGASVLGVVGASEDGSYVYFVAKGALAVGASAGEPNLYVWHETGERSASVSFIATLKAPNDDEEEEPDEEELIEEEKAGPHFQYRSDLADWTSRPVESQAYVTPDGKHLAFMSARPLTGYDNDDQATGEPDHEVYEYSAETGVLVCASCDPSGERPLGSAFIGAKLTERVSSPFHQPRSLSDDGSRLFFSSPDPLVPGISGASARLYEYEDGSVQLISGSEPGGSAVFLDASASGDDVFFATRERLAPSDDDELVDVYDARVDGGLSEPPAAGGCSPGACQQPLSAPPTFPPTVSELFEADGNLAPPPSAKPTRKQLLERALAKCRRMKRRKKRAACQAAARRRYGPKLPTPRRRGATAHRTVRG